MSFAIRPCRDREELQRYAEVVSYVFAVNEAEELQREIDATVPEWTMCAFEGERLVSSLAVLPFEVRLNGRDAAMGGVTAVGTLPEVRRRGLLRQTMVAAMERMREQGQAFAILWASMGAIYQRFGYGLASPYIEYRFAPGDLAMHPGLESTGRWQLGPFEDALPVMEEVFEAYRAPRNLALKRNDFFWKDVTLREKKKRRPYTAIYRSAAGEPRGYLAFRTREDEDQDDPGPNQVMEVADMAWLDLDAYVACWEHLASHDLVKRVEMGGLMGDDDPVQHLLLEPRMLQKRVGDAIWMRVVDVPAALTARPYAQDGRLRLGIVDTLFGENAGTWELTIEGGEARVQRTDAPADLEMPVATLATLISGHRTATALLHAGRLSARTPASVRLADQSFATEYASFLPNEF